MTDSNKKLISTKASTDLHSRTINIGTWNLVASSYIDIIIPVDIIASNISVLDALIRADVDFAGGEDRFSLSALGGYTQILPGNRIRINRQSTGVYTNYSGSGNRGWLTIFYSN